jgi:hypothetical protein
MNSYQLEIIFSLTSSFSVGRIPSSRKPYPASMASGLILKFQNSKAPRHFNTFSLVEAFFFCYKCYNHTRIEDTRVGNGSRLLRGRGNENRKESGLEKRDCKRGSERRQSQCEANPVVVRVSAQLGGGKTGVPLRSCQVEEFNVRTSK